MSDEEDATSGQFDRVNAVPMFDIALRRATSNLLRVLAGAGKPELLLDNLAEVVERACVFKDVFGQFPSMTEVQNVVHFETDYLSRNDLDNAELKVWRGSLRVIASRLEGNLTQESRAESLAMEGVREIEDLRANRRRGLRY
jgi:hypothetical protein